MLDRGDIQRITESYTKLFDSVGESIQTGTLDLTAKAVKAIKDNADYLVLGQDTINLDAALYRALGPQQADKYYIAQTDTQRLNTAQELVRRNLLSRMATQGTSVPQIAREAKSNRIGDNVIADIYRSGQDLLKNPSVPPEVWNNVFRSLYGSNGNPDQVFAIAKNNLDARKIYEKWASPAMTQAVKARAATNPELMTNYNRWVLRGAETVFTRELSDIRDTTSQGSLVVVEWTGEGFRDKPAPNP
jgi:hypothetical protein